jgi:hypothetical protein
MPRYFFHVRDRQGLLRDEEGRELPSPEVARAEAAKGVRSILSEEVGHGTLDLLGSVEVLDEAGHLVFSLRFDEAVEIRAA